MRDNIENGGADDITTVLSHSTKLKTLNIRRNKLESDGVMKIIQGLQGISTLKNFYIGGNNVGVKQLMIL